MCGGWKEVYECVGWLQDEAGSTVEDGMWWGRMAQLALNLLK